MSDHPTWYDLLDVPRDASAGEIRAAWKSQIADLEPGDRRFDSLNRAAKVLLDPAARAAYDAEHPEDTEDTEDTEDAADQPAADAGPDPTTRLTHVEMNREHGRLLRHRSKEQAAERRAVEKEQRAASPAPAAGGVPGWLLVGLALVAAGLVAATTWMWVTGDGGDESAAREAQVAAERAVVPVLSYDYEQDRKSVV